MADGSGMARAETASFIQGESSAVATNENDWASVVQFSTAFLVVSPEVTLRCTFLASLSGTFLQTLPELVTPLKGHSLSPRSCPPTRSAPSERFGY